MTPQLPENTTELPANQGAESKLKVYSGPPLIYSRIAACIAEVEAVGKDHRNHQQGYAFRAIDDFYDSLQPVLARNKVFITPTILEFKREERTTKNGGAMMTTLAHVRFRVWTEDGSFIEADALGEGADAGDKSANKAASQALKYLFMQVFCVRVTSEQLDTERASPEYQQRAPQPPPSNQRAYQMQSDRTYQKTAPQANQERTAATPASVLEKKASPRTQEYMWNALATEFGPDVTWNFLVGKGWVNAESDDYSTWNLDHVPTSKQALSELADEIRSAENDKAANSQLVVDSSSETDMPADIFDAVITVPRRGMKRDEYLKNPDTIGSLYVAMKGGDQEAQKRLWGLVKGWQPEPYVDRQGKKWPVKPEDAQCRMDLDRFAAWYDEKHGNTQAT